MTVEVASLIEASTDVKQGIYFENLKVDSIASSSLAGQTLTRRRESGQIPIRLSCCILSSRVPNEVGGRVLKGRTSVEAPRSISNMPKKATARPIRH